MTQSREVLAVMDAHTTTFGRKRGCTISRCGGFLLGAFFLICLVATGLLVYHFAPCLREKQAKQCDFLDSPLVRTGKSFSVPTTRKRVDVRLPKAVVPDSYELWLTPFIWEGNFTFHGEVAIFDLLKKKIFLLNKGNETVRHRRSMTSAPFRVRLERPMRF